MLIKSIFTIFVALDKHDDDGHYCGDDVVEKEGGGTGG